MFAVVLREPFKDKGEIIAAIAVGYPDECPSERPRKDLSKITDFIKYKL